MLQCVIRNGIVKCYQFFVPQSYMYSLQSIDVFIWSFAYMAWYTLAELWIMCLFSFSCSTCICICCVTINDFELWTFEVITSLSVGSNYLFISKLQCWNRWSLGMDELFHPTLFWACNYLYMLGLKLNHVSKRGPWMSSYWCTYIVIPDSAHLSSWYMNATVLCSFFQSWREAYYCSPEIRCRNFKCIWPDRLSSPINGL